MGSVSAAPDARGATHAVALARPTFDERELELVGAVLRSGWVTQGPKVGEFERAFAARVGAREAVAVSNATTALFLALHAQGIGPGDEVLVPSLSFIATANCVVHAGATPVFVDVEPRSCNVDPACLERAVGPKTRAIVAVDQLGLPADMERILALGRRHDLVVVEDAACAAGTRVGGRALGAGRHATCFSFHPRKVLVTGEGGMITTDDAELAAKLRLLRHQGMSVSDLERHRAVTVLIEEYPVVGYNFRLPDVLAALGLAQLEKLDVLLSRRRAAAAFYDQHLAHLDVLERPSPAPDVEYNYQSYMVRLKGAERVQRNRVMDGLQARGVATRRGLMAIHREACYRTARRADALEHTERATDQTLLLPMHAELTREDLEHVVRALLAALVEAGLASREASA
jgi:dTDP-4-amino-4,6-dideoxygalactose transaminase